MSILTIIAISAYLGTCLLCLAAAPKARQSAKPTREYFGWIICGFWFVIIALVRALNLEEKTREALRAVISEFGMYRDRTTFQIPLGILVFALGVLLLLLFWRKFDATRERKGERLLLLAQFASLGFLLLYALRFVSLHAIDALLYSGPLRLNWLLDGAITVTVAFCAILYIRLCRRHIEQRQHGDPRHAGQPRRNKQPSRGPKRRDKH